MAAPRKYPDELRERATRMAVELRADPATKQGAIARVAEQLGMHRETLRNWVRQAEIDGGVRPEDIDYVLCTHLHADHVGWNTRLENGRWVPAFPNARYIFSQKELDFWTEREAKSPETCPWVTDSVLPVVASGCHQCVTSDHAFEDTVRLIPTPGHTIDHFSVELGAKHPDAIIGGDMIHSPLQLLYPDMGMFSDYNSKQAGETRRALFSRIMDTPTKLCTAHFADPSIIRITGEKNGGFAWAYA